MVTFLLIYRADPTGRAAMAEPTPEQAAEIMQAWNAWAERIGEAVVDFGNPTVAASRGADPTIGGYSLLQADSSGALEALLEGHPHVALGGSIDVYEVKPVQV